MSKTSIIRTALNGGEVAPELQWRTDLNRFVNSCLELENFLVQPTGGVKRRPGTEFIAAFPPDRAVRILPFEFSSLVYYVVVLRERLQDEAEPEGEGNAYAVFLEVYATDGTRAAAIETAYPADSLERVQHVQSYDVLFLAHPDVPLMRLERVDPTSWQLREHPMRGGPYHDTNVDNTVGVKVWFEPYIPERDYEVGDCVSGVAAITLPTSDTITLLGDTDTRLVEWVEGGRKYVRQYRRLRLRLTDAPPATVKPGMVALFRDPAGTGWLARPILRATGGTPNRLDVDSEYYEQTVYDWQTGEEIDIEDRPGDIDDNTGDFPEDPWEPTNIYVCPDYAPQGIISDDDTLLEDFYEFTVAVEGNAGETLADRVSDGFVQDAKLYTGRAYAVALVTTLAQGTMVLPESAGFATGAPIPVSQVGNLFAPHTVGGRFKVVIPGGQTYPGTFYNNGGTRYRNANTVATLDFATGTSYPLTKDGVSVRAYGAVRLRTQGGIWSGRMVLQSSPDRENWTTLGTIASQGNYNGEIERDIGRSAGFVRARMDFMGALTPNEAFGPTSTDDGTAFGPGITYNICPFTITVIDDVSEEYIVEDVILDRGYFAQLRGVYGVHWRASTYRFAFGVFGPQAGYPSALTFHEERLWLAGTATSPNTLWASAINDFEEFQLGTLATSPIALTIASDQLNRVRWLRSHGDLLAGCDDSEWMIDGRDADSPITASNIRARRTSTFGAEPVQAVAGIDHLAYIQRGGLKVRGLAYSWEAESYQASDMTAVATHLGPDGGGFVEVHHVPVPFDMLWVLRADGQVAVLSWDAVQQVDGWARMKFGHGGGVQSLCVTPGGAHGRQLWLVVDRGDDEFMGGRAYCLERLDLGADVFLDCHIRALDEEGVEEFAVAPVLGELGFAVVGNGALRMGDAVDSRSRYTFGDGKDWTLAGDFLLAPRDPTRWTDIVAGYRYGSRARPLPPLLGGDAYGGRVLLNELTLYLRDSWAADVSVDGGSTFETLAMHTEGAAFGPVLVTGPVRLKRSSGAREALDVVVRCESYMQFHLCALAASVQRLE